MRVAGLFAGIGGTSNLAFMTPGMKLFYFQRFGPRRPLFSPSGFPPCRTWEMSPTSNHCLLSTC